MSMLIACSMVKLVSVTRSKGMICSRPDMGLMALGSSTAASNWPVDESMSVRVRNPRALWPGMGNSTSTTRCTDSSLFIMVSMSLRTEL